MRRHLLPLLALPVLASPCRGQDLAPTDSTMATAFVDVAVVSTTDGTVRPGRTVVVRGDRIVSVGPPDAVAVPGNARRIEGEGRYLMPGLADMHVHLLADAHDVPLYLANGVTTIRNLGGGDSVLALRDAIAAGERLGPTIVTSGNWLDGDPPVRSINTVVRSPAEARRIVTEQKAAGYDFVKVYANLDPVVYREIVETAEEVGIPVVGHVPRSMDVETVLRSGQVSIDHAGQFTFFHFGRDLDDLDPSGIPEIARATRRAGVAVTPTLAVFESVVIQRRSADGLGRLLARPETRYLAPGVMEYWRGVEAQGYRGPSPYLESAFEFTRRVVAGLRDAGVRILLGTDAGVVGVVPGFSIHRELRAMVDAGLTPLEALRAGTVSASAFLGAPDEFGSIEVGRRADLVLVRGDPLEDVANASRIDGVMVRGRWLSRSELERMLESAARDDRGHGSGGTSSHVLADSGSVRTPSVERPMVLPEECEIELALSAAPEHLRERAGVWVMREDGYTRVREGTNGFACIVNRDDPRSLKPTCFDPEGTRTIVPRIELVGRLLLSGTPADEIQRRVDAALASGELARPDRAGVAYMLSPHNRPWNHRRGGLGRFPPHVMFHAPDVTNEDIGTTREARRETPALPFVAYEGPHGFILVVTDDVPPGRGDVSSCPSWVTGESKE